MVAAVPIDPATDESDRVLVISARPDGVADWIRSMSSFREVLWVLVQKDFRTRYKRASFGVLWAVAVPALQAVIMAAVFSRIIRTGTGHGFPVYVMSGVIAFSYFGATLPVATSSIVDGASLTDKVWFPRATLVIIPAITNLVGLGVTMAVLALVMPIFSVGYSIHLLYLLPATLLLVVFTVALTLVTSATQVYFRDMKFIVQAALMVWMYVTPVVYPQHLLGRFSGFLDLNPLTGIVDVFHMGVLGSNQARLTAILVSLGFTILLLIAGVMVQMQHDRLFVDKL